MTIQAPAKVNLALRILGKRSDGFHDVETLMVPISLSDEIHVDVQKEGAGIELECNDPTVPTDSTNLAYRAAAAFASHTGLSFGTRIYLKKNIPLGAGLGGGSSDAAAVLLALNSLFSTHLDDSALAAVAAMLGADVPFFIYQRSALCRGRGEIIETLGNRVPERPLLLIKPPFPVLTSWAYQAWGSDRVSQQKKRQYLGEIELINDLEFPVFSKYVFLSVLKNWLLEQQEVESAMMSGSGSTVFAVLHQTSDALVSRIRDVFGSSMWVYPCQIRNCM